MKRHPWTLFVCVVAAIATRFAIAEEAPPSGTAEVGERRFLRLTRNDDGDPLTMETAIVSYVPGDNDQQGLRVDLIGAVHIGERSYYEQLNREFENYDVVLYELVAPKGTRIPKGGRPSAHPIAMLQSGMRDMLALESQVELIDYEKPNLVHADMSPEEFAQSMELRGDNFFVMFFRMMGRSIALQSRQQALAREGKAARRTSDVDLLMALFDPRRSHRMKQLMAEQFEDLEGMTSVLEGPDGSTIISERNKMALAGLREQIDQGHKRIGVFYGAGHMPDMERRLQTDFGLKRSGERWLAAWHLQPTGVSHDAPPSDANDNLERLGD